MIYLIGIYSITNTITGEMYIGQSLSIHKRWNNHLEQLELNSHHSDKLQESYNKYGISAFGFKVLELMPISHCQIKCCKTKDKLFNILLCVRESYYMKKYNTLNNGFNTERSICSTILQYADSLIKNNLLNDSIYYRDIYNFINGSNVNNDISLIDKEQLQIMLDKLPLELDDVKKIKSQTKEICKHQIQNTSDLPLHQAIIHLPDFFQNFAQPSAYNVFKNEKLIFKNDDMKKYAIAKENDYLYVNERKTVCVTKQGLRFLKNKFINLLLSDEELQLNSYDKIVYPLLTI